MMKRLLMWILAMALVTPFAATAAGLSPGEKDTIFIDDLKVLPSLLEKAEQDGRTMELKRVSETLEAQFTTALSATRVFQLVEHKHLQSLSHEQNFAASVMNDGDTQNIAKAGKMLGARFVFIPVIDGFEVISHPRIYEAIGRMEITSDMFLSAIVKVVDTTTGELLPEAPSIQLKKTDVQQDVPLGQEVGSEELLVALAKELAQQLSQETVALLRPARVLSVKGKQVLINRGTEAGFNNGDLVEFYAVESIRDEESGETFRNEIPIGQGTIVRIDKKQSFAMISGDDLGVAVGCIVKRFQMSPVPAGPATGATVPPETPGSSEKPMKW